jgi:hypothetical protein
MADPRGYSAGTRAALAQLSRGSCYNPECTRSIIRFVDGEPYVDYQIAHIRDARPGNRYAAAMTDDDRRSFANLVLLCKPCHTLVDNAHPEDYSIERLDAWKRKREGAGGQALAGLGSLDEATLAQFVRASVRVAIGNSAVAVSEAGGRVRATSVGLPRLLPLEPATVPPGPAASPTRLVRARSGVIPFAVHHDLRASLMEWCLEDGSFSARLIAGKGGAGKTRLAVQLCEDLAPFGWIRGLLTPEVDQPELEALVAAPTARLVVIDYAEARTDQVARVLAQLDAWATTEQPVRVLLLVRPRRGQDWAWTLRHGGDVLDALVDEMVVDVLDEAPLVEDSRRELFSVAAEAFTHRAGSGEIPESIPDLGGPCFSTPLLVVVKAYLEVHGSHGDPQTRGELLEELLRHEDRYWRSTGPEAPTDPVLRRRVVALASLTGAGSEADAAGRLRLVPDLVNADEERRRSLARWADGLYRVRLGWWNPMEPDLVAEHLIATTYHDHPDVLAGVLRASADLVTRPIELYARAVADHRQLAVAVGPILSQELCRLCQAAIDQATTATDRDQILGDATIAAALGRWAQVTEIDTPALIEAVELLPRRPNLVLTALSVVLTSQLVAQQRRSAAADPAAHEPALASSLNNLSVRLGEAGRRDEGLAAIEAAVEINRRLVATNPIAYELDLALSLNNLSNRLAMAGRRDEGLDAIVEAVEIYRRLATANPATYEPDLAMSLNNLSVRLAEAGRRDEGLAAIIESVEVNRRLAAAKPATYEPDLATSLNNLSVRLAEAGRRDQGLDAIIEAVEIYRRLAAANPAAYDPNLALSMNNLSVRLGEAGRRDEGLKAIIEAVEIYRRLAAANPAASEPDLAMSLNNLSVRLGEAGRRDEGLAAIMEAVEVNRRLAAANRPAYDPDLASSLNNQSLRLGEAGRQEEGLAAIFEAVEVYRRLAAANRAAHDPALASSLNNLSVRLGEAGRRDEALAAVFEAVEIRRRLAAVKPAAYDPDLAISLNNLSNRLGEAGRRDDALAAIIEAVEVNRCLVATNRAAYDPALASSLNNLSNRLGEAGRRDDALTAIEAAVEIRRRLAAANPLAYEPDLATSLKNLSNRLGEAGQRDQAEKSQQEAVELDERIRARRK